MKHRKRKEQRKSEKPFAPKIENNLEISRVGKNLLAGWVFQSTSIES